MTTSWIADVADRMRRHEVGIIPCDTVWSVSGIMTPSIAARLCSIKNRPPEKPLLVLIGSIDQLSALCAPLSHAHIKLIHSVWPGPTTIILPKSSDMPANLVANQPGVAIRLPNAPWLIELIQQIGEPIFSTSANSHGHPIEMDPARWDKDVSDRVDFVITDPMTMTGTPSTIINALVDPFVTVRQI